MPSRLEELAAGWQDRALSPSEQSELLALVNGSEESAWVASRDRLVDRWLRQSRRPSLDAEVILRAIAEDPAALASRTMAELERRHASVPSGGSGYIRRLLAWSLTGRSRLTVLAGAVTVLALAIWYLSPLLAPRVEVGQFAVIVGKPKLQHPWSRVRLEASRSTNIYLGDSIQTGDADKTEIRFHDGTTLRLSFNTTLEIPRVNPVRTSAGAANGPGSNQSPGIPGASSSTVARPAELKLERGQVWAVVQKATNQARFAIRTPVATASVKGTEFGLKLRKAGAPTLAVGPSIPGILEALLTVKEGAVDFFNSSGRVLATDLTESVATGNAAPTPPKRVGTLKVFRVGPLNAKVATTSRPSLPEAAYRLVYRTGWAGLDVADVAAVSPTQPPITNPAPEQVRVVRVQKNSPAETAGLRLGETVLALNGRAITNAWEVSAAIAERVGGLITLTLAGEPAPRAMNLVTITAPDAPPLPPLARTTAAVLDAAARLLLERRYDEGERALTELLRTDASPAAHSDLGLLYETRDDLAQALAHYQAAVEAGTQVALYHFNYALALQNIGNLERAAEEAQLATALAPSWGEALQVLSEICSPLGRSEEALRAVDAALRVHPASPDIWLSRGTALADQNRNEEARQAFLKALELEPDYSEACRELGDLYHHENRLDEAERLVTRATEINPSDAGAFNILGNIHISQGRYPDAERALREAIRLDPAVALTYSNLGYLFRRLGQADEAEKMYRKSIELDPDSPIGFSNLGELLRRIGRLDEAERMLRTAIDLDPQGAAAMNNLGGLYLYNRHQPDQAEKILQQAIQVDPTYPYPFQNLGNLMLNRGNSTEAENMYRKAIDLFGKNPGAAVSWVRLGKIQEMRHDAAAAIQSCRKALALQPDLTEAADALKRLGQ